jgi:hypothetical protein
MSIEDQFSLQPMRPFLLTIATVLICAGSAMGLFFVYMIYKVLTSPEDVKIVAYINQYIGEGGKGLGEKILSGIVEGQQVAINISDTGMLISLIFLLLLALSAFSAVARMLIEGGAAIFKIYTRPLRYEIQDKVTPKKY